MRETLSRNSFAAGDADLGADAIRIPPELAALWQEMRSAIATGLAAEPIDSAVLVSVESEFERSSTGSQSQLHA